jgi:phosphatidylglycerol:prolipoprotein diacylglycerol transferase
MDITRTGIEIGPLTLHFYGVLIVAGILAAANVGAWMAKKDGKDPEHLWNGLVWAVIAGVIGARLWFVFFPPVASVEAGKTTAWMLSHPFDLQDGPLAIWNGGLGIFGGIIGGALGIWLYARRHKIRDLRQWLDIAAVIVPLGHAIGRWGNYVNQELYGEPTDLPWGIKIDAPVFPYSPDDRFHPLFLYESLWNLVLFSALFYLWNKQRQRFKDGDFVLLYLVGYSVVRFLLEFLRVEVAEIQGVGVNSSQTITAIAFVVALALFLYRHRDFRFASQARFHPDGRPVGKSHKAEKKS